LYGPGGIGKSTLASLAPKPRFLDLESSTCDLDTIERVTLPDGKDRWTVELIRSALSSPELWKGCETIVIDTATKLQDICLEYTLRTVSINKHGERATNIEDYGYGKGFGFLYDSFMLILNDMDNAWRRGLNIILIAHDCTNRVPNPEGEDFIRYEPRLSDPTSGKNSIRLKVREWCDHLLRIGYDITTDDGKARGSGSRTIYAAEMPHFMAKSRTLSNPIEFTNKNDDTLWKQLFKKGTK